MGLPEQTRIPSFTDQVSGEVLTSTQLVRSLPLKRLVKPNCDTEGVALFSWAERDERNRTAVSAFLKTIPYASGLGHALKRLLFFRIGNKLIRAFVPECDEGIQFSRMLFR